MTEPTDTPRPLAELIAGLEREINYVSELAFSTGVPGLRRVEDVMVAALTYLREPGEGQDACPVCKGEGQWAVYEGKEHDESHVDYCQTCGGRGYVAPSGDEPGRTGTELQFLRDALDEALAIDWDDHHREDVATDNDRDATRVDVLFERIRSAPREPHA